MKSRIKENIEKDIVKIIITTMICATVIFWALSNRYSFSHTHGLYKQDKITGKVWRYYSNSGWELCGGKPKFSFLDMIKKN
jgi:hypothetical protein